APQGLLRREIRMKGASKVNFTIWKRAFRSALPLVALAAAALAPAVAQRDPQAFREALRQARGVHLPGYPGLGGAPSDPAALAKIPRVRLLPGARGDRPSRLVLTDYLPPIGDQG